MDYLIFLNGFSWIMLFIFGSTFCIHQIIETSKPGTIFELQALASEVEDFSTYEACQGTMFVVFRKAKWGFRVIYGLYMGYISYIYMGFSWADQHDKTKGRRNWLLASNGVLSPWDDDGNPDMELVYICLKNWEPTVPLYYSVFHHAP